MQIQPHPSKKNEVGVSEMFQLQGCEIAAFEIDSQNVQNDMKAKVEERFFLLATNQKVYHLVNLDNEKFIDQVIIIRGMYE